MTVTQAAESRKSVRKYTDEAIPQAKIEEILRVAGLAPSPWNLQPWRVTVVTDPDLKAKVAEAAYNQPQVSGAQAVLVIHSDMKDVLDKVEDTVHPGMGDRKEAEAANMRKTFGNMGDEASETWGNAISYIFLGFLLLAIEEAGYGSSPMLGFDPAKMKDVLDLPEHVRMPAIVAIGKKAEEGFPHHRHPLDRFVDWR
ncbi:MAG: nitroreductase family protein [Chthonomonas sp.]|nr:nitroreductase family protein [Chthonomonas sp.]